MYGVTSGQVSCKITTPVLGYDVEPFQTGDIVYLEGIDYTTGSGDGFNSGDYKFIDLNHDQDSYKNFNFFNYYIRLWL